MSAAVEQIWRTYDSPCQILDLAFDERPLTLFKLFPPCWEAGSWRDTGGLCKVTPVVVRGGVYLRLASLTV